MATAEIKFVVPKSVLEAAQQITDTYLGVTLANMLPASRTANDGRMRAILGVMTPEQRADLACLGANLVELINEIGREQWEAERAAQDSTTSVQVDASGAGVRAQDKATKDALSMLKSAGLTTAAADQAGPECYDCETSGSNCLAHRAAEERRRAGW